VPVQVYDTPRADAYGTLGPCGAGRYGRLLRTGVRARLSDESRHTGDDVVEGSRGAGKESTGEVYLLFKSKFSAIEHEFEDEDEDDF
jgi:hypothetical protein